jgi:hypothetical protein
MLSHGEKVRNGAVIQAELLITLYEFKAITPEGTAEDRKGGETSTDNNPSSYGYRSV